MNIAIYPGSFDPITKGHLDVLKSGSEIFDKVIIAVATNSEKSGFLPVKVRVELIKKAVKEMGLRNVEVDSFTGLTIDYAKQKDAEVLLRGLRAVSDFEYEMQLSQTNSALCDNIKTVFMITKPEYNFISSSTVKEIYENNGDISKFVPKAVDEYLKNKL
ncbi:MAG: pantetheine-phosphate adenylyltransferase [Clostridiaceae bacterium]|jgi:pantetheine-phosphate adenylyltransferase|nr:pantetheine-phosphate adenylyltransferase [Clostridiaceae bacterium]